MTITDANGCSDSTSVTLTEPAAPVAAMTVDSNVSCNGLSDGGITTEFTSGTAPFTYTWSNGDTTASIGGLAAGSYSVIITDSLGCTATGDTMITEPALLISSTTLDSNVTCNSFTTEEPQQARAVEQRPTVTSGAMVRPTKP